MPSSGGSELCGYMPDNAVHTPAQDETGIDRAIRAREQALAAMLREQGQSPRKHYCGNAFTLPAATDMAGLTAEISAMLGADWEVLSSEMHDGIHIRQWRSRSRFWPRQYFIVLVSAIPAHHALLPAHSVYLQDNDSKLHGYVVYATALSPFFFIFLIALYLRKRLRTRRAARTQKEESSRS